MPRLQAPLEPMSTPFAARLCYRRWQMRMTRPRLAALAQVTSGYIGMLEGGRRQPSDELVELLAVALDTTVEWLREPVTREQLEDWAAEMRPWLVRPVLIGDSGLPTRFRAPPPESAGHSADSGVVTRLFTALAGLDSTGLAAVADYAEQVRRKRRALPDELEATPDGDVIPRRKRPRGSPPPPRGDR